ncbi:MAG TPA: glycosyl hydrolase [Gemmatimonadaceae bacterium]|nr:glycosyl hydrolase [Gemmatimonadaceae bacterium]
MYRRSFWGMLAVVGLVASQMAAQVAPPRQSTSPRPAARPLPPVPSSPVRIDTLAFASLRWREVGPPRGGRSVAVAGSAARPNEYWMGTTGGGVFKTTDGGVTWQPASDGFFGGTIGAIAVDPRNPDVVWVGGGETCIRGNTSHGDGLWKTTDGGRTWQFLGFREEHIASIEIHPSNTDVVYIGVFGDPFKATPNRGLYRTNDGGRSFQKILFVNDSTGVIDISMDPSNPNVLYVAMWQAYRTPWSMSSGGIHSGLFKTTDGGITWVNLTATAKGLPRGILGKIGVAVSPARPTRVWALIEHDSGGVYRSDDGGATWEYLNRERKLRQRAWYYTHIYADPRDPEVVYALNTGFYRSRDGGRTFPQQIAVPHGDNHDLWIAPNDPNRMINANDGGANVSVNGGRTWTDQDYPTAQFYHVDVTNEFPYHICGAQQDNSTLCGPSRKEGGIAMGDWYDAGGGESGYVTPNPRDPNVIFAGSYGGLLTRKDRRTGFERNVTVWPINPMGHSSEDIEVRFQWTFPIVFSRHAPNVLYAAGSRLFRSTNEGESWTPVSPELARRDPRTMGPSGGPITKDQTGVETYAVIFAFDESPVQPGVLWAGTDDGLIWVSRNNGATWENVTPSDIGDFTRISIIEPSNFVAGGAYVAANRYQQGDKRPILYKTTDFGKTWTKIVNGIAPDHFTRVIREDPVRRGLLFAGTERGVYVSFDDGLSWQVLNRNLPIVPIHDLRIKDNDVVVATHGRSFWVLDDISVLRQVTPDITARGAHLFKPADVYRVNWGGRGGGVGSNPPSGAIIQYWLKEGGQRVQLDFLDAKGAVIRTFASEGSGAQADSARPAGEAEGPPFGQPSPSRVPNRAGLNTFVWNLRYPDAVGFTGLIMWAASTAGPVAPPGTYAVRLTVGSEVQTQNFKVLKDPRSTASDADLQEQFRLLIAIRDKVSEANNAVRTVRNMRWQVEDRAGKLSGEPRQEFGRLAGEMMEKLTESENDIYQTRNQSNQDPLNYPIKLNNKIAALSGVVASGEYRPTKQSYDAFARLSKELDVELAEIKNTLDGYLPRLNAILKAAGLPELVPSTEEPPRRPGVTM